MHDLLLPPSLKGLKEVFNKQSNKIRSIPPAVFSEKAVLKIFRKLVEKYS